MSLGYCPMPFGSLLTSQVFIIFMIARDGTQRLMDLWFVQFLCPSLSCALLYTHAEQFTQSLQPRSLAWMPFLQPYWGKPFAVPLESSCHRGESRKGPLGAPGSHGSEETGVTRNCLSFALKAKRSIFRRQKFLWAHPAEQVLTITWQNLLN